MSRCAHCHIEITGSEAAHYCSYECMEQVLGRELAQKLENERKKRFTAFSEEENETTLERN